MLTTTLNRIREHSPCKEGWDKLLKHLGKTQADDEHLPYSVILESNGLDDALWCCRAEPQYSKEWRLFAVWCAEQVIHLTDDERSKNALVVAKKFAYGEASQEELAAAWDAARAAARDAAWDAARDAVRDTAWDAARAAARAAAWDAAWDAARDAAWAAARAAARDAVRDTAWDAARAAARAAAMDAAWDAARDVQAKHFIKICSGE